LQPNYDFHYKADCTQPYPISYPVAATGYPGVYYDFALYPYPVAYRQVFTDNDYYSYDRRYSGMTQSLRAAYYDAASRSTYELTPSPPSPGVAAMVPPSSCRLVTSSENKMASIAEARNCAYAAAYTGNGIAEAHQQQCAANSSPNANTQMSPSPSSSSGLHRAPVPASSSPVNLASAAAAAAAGGSSCWSERRRTVIMGDADTVHHQSVIRRMRAEPTRAANSAIHDYQRRLKSAAAGAVPGPIYSESLYTSARSDDDEDDDPEEEFKLPASTHVAPYFRVQHQHRLQHPVPTGSHVTGYTSVIVDTQQLHSNGYVH